MNFHPGRPSKKDPKKQVADSLTASTKSKCFLNPNDIVGTRVCLQSTDFFQKSKVHFDIDSVQQHKEKEASGSTTKAEVSRSYEERYNF